MSIAFILSVKKLTGKAFKITNENALELSIFLFPSKGNFSKTLPSEIFNHECFIKSECRFFIQSENMKNEFLPMFDGGV